MESYGPVVLRITVGVIFVAHGVDKLFGIWGGGLSGTAAYFAQMGLSPAVPLALLAGVTEIAGGLLLVAGAWTRSVAIALAITRAVAIWKIHLANGLFINWSAEPGRARALELTVLMIGTLLCLFLTGPGALSIDHRRARSAEADAAGRARLRGKL